MKHILLTLAALFGAIICYAAGFGNEIIFLIITGVLLEIVFWVSAFRGSRS